MHSAALGGGESRFPSTCGASLGATTAVAAVAAVGAVIAVAAAAAVKAVGAVMAVAPVAAGAVAPEAAGRTAGATAESASMAPGGLVLAGDGAGAGRGGGAIPAAFGGGDFVSLGGDHSLARSLDRAFFTIGLGANGNGNAPQPPPPPLLMPLPRLPKLRPPAPAPAPVMVVLIVRFTEVVMSARGEAAKPPPEGEPPSRSRRSPPVSQASSAIVCLIFAFCCRCFYFQMTKSVTIDFSPLALCHVETPSSIEAMRVNATRGRSTTNSSEQTCALARVFAGSRVQRAAGYVLTGGIGW